MMKPSKIIDDNDNNVIPCLLYNNELWNILVKSNECIYIGNRSKLTTTNTNNNVVDVGPCSSIQPRHLRLAYNAKSLVWEIRCIGLYGVYINDCYYPAYYPAIVLNNGDYVVLESTCNTSKCICIHRFQFLSQRNHKNTSQTHDVHINTNETVMEWQPNEMQSVVDGLLTFGYARMTEVFNRLVLQQHRTITDMKVIMKSIIVRIIQHCTKQEHQTFLRYLYYMDCNESTRILQSPLLTELSTQLNTTTNIWCIRLMHLHLLGEIFRLSYSQCKDIMLYIPTDVYTHELPCIWWSKYDDRSLLWGIYIHGYSQWQHILNDTTLPFTHSKDHPEFPSTILLEKRVNYILTCLNKNHKINHKITYIFPLLSKQYTKTWKMSEMVIVVRYIVEYGITDDIHDKLFMLVQTKTHVAIRDVLQIIVYEMEANSNALNDRIQRYNVTKRIEDECKLRLEGLSNVYSYKPLPLVIPQLSMYIRERILFFHFLRKYILCNDQYEEMIATVVKQCVQDDLKPPSWWIIGEHDCKLLNALHIYGCEEWIQMFKEYPELTKTIKFKLLRRAYYIVKSIEAVASTSASYTATMYYEKLFYKLQPLPPTPMFVYLGLMDARMSIITKTQLTCVSLALQNSSISCHYIPTMSSYGVERLLMKSDGVPLLPLPLSFGFTLYRLGLLYSNRMSCFSKECIYPLGYICVCRHQSIVKPSELATYKCEILPRNDTNLLLFCVTCGDDPTRQFIGETPQKVWNKIYDCIQYIVGKAAILEQPDGNERFGLKHPVILSLLHDQLRSLECNPYPYEIKSTSIQRYVLRASMNEETNYTDLRTIVPADLPYE